MPLTFAQWVARPSSQKVYVAQCTLTRISDDASLTIYVGTDGAVWDGTNYYEPCMVGIPSVEHEAQSLTSGEALVSFGEIELAAQAGKAISGALTLDDLVSAYAWEGGAITVKVGGPDLAWANWGTVIVGYMGAPSFTDDTVTVPVFSRGEKLRSVKLPPNLYDNTFPASTEGRAKPLCWGWCYNISPVLIDDTLFKYQFLDPAYGPAEAVTAVFVDGVQQATPAQYSVDLANGIIDFVADPAGTVTADVKGRKVSGSFVDTASAIIQDILTTFGGFASGDLDSAAFSAYATALAYSMGLYITDQVDIKTAIDSLTNGLLTIFSSTRAGLFSASLFTAPSGTPDLEITDRDILDFSVEPEERLYWRVKMGAYRNWTVQSSPDATVTTDRRARLAEEYSFGYDTDTGVLTTYPLATEADHATLIAAPSSVEQMAAKWMALFGQRRWQASVTLKLQPLQVELGDVVQVTRSRWGLDSGKLFRVVGLEEDYMNSQIKLTLWG